MSKNIYWHIVHISIFCITGLVITSCDWVDATGRQGNLPPEIGVIVDEQVLDENQVIGLLARQSRTIDFSSSIDPDGEVVEFSSSLIDEGKLSQCAELFDLTTSADRLSEACDDAVSSTECDVSLLTLAEANGDEDSENPQPNGQFLITPPKLDTSIGLTYRWTLTDNDGDNSTRDITLCLIVQDAPPMAFADNYQLNYGGSITIPDIVYTDDCSIQSGTTSVLGNDSSNSKDGDCLIAILVTPPDMAANDFSGDFTSKGGFIYSHDGLSGNSSDSFSYRVFDGLKFSAIVDVTLNINLENNRFPIAKNDLFNIDRNSTGNALFVIQNDLDPENLPLTVTKISTLPNKGGIVKIKSEGYIEYSPAINFLGVESFIYEVSDAAGATDNALVRLKVESTD